MNDQAFVAASVAHSISVEQKLKEFLKENFDLADGILALVSAAQSYIVCLTDEGCPRERAKDLKRTKKFLEWFRAQMTTDVYREKLRSLGGIDG